jgi:hypothetical protein
MDYSNLNMNVAGMSTHNEQDKMEFVKGIFWKWEDGRDEEMGGV